MFSGKQITVNVTNRHHKKKPYRQRKTIKTDGRKKRERRRLGDEVPGELDPALGGDGANHSVGQPFASEGGRRAVPLVHSHQKAKGGLRFLQRRRKIGAYMIEPVMVPSQPNVVPQYTKQGGKNNQDITAGGKPNRMLKADSGGACGWALWNWE